jgi:hypothetical protein
MFRRGSENKIPKNRHVKLGKLIQRQLIFQIYEQLYLSNRLTDGTAPTESAEVRSLSLFRSVHWTLD